MTLPIIINCHYLWSIKRLRGWELSSRNASSSHGKYESCHQPGTESERRLVSTSVLRPLWHKPQLHHSVPLCSQALIGLFPKLLAFSQCYTPALHCGRFPHPRTTLHPGIPESQPGTMRKQWDCPDSLWGLCRLWSRQHVAAILSRPLWEGTHPPALSAHGRTKAADAWVSRGAHQGEPRPCISPRYPTPIHT